MMAMQINAVQLLQVGWSWMAMQMAGLEDKEETSQRPLLRLYRL